ncbi:MAG: SMC-Scp complex subunit ScpB [Bacteroidetes bacterium]|nr:SMC-Scp complex subunit ScpB [Bacteroidota bacterium]
MSNFFVSQPRHRQKNILEALIFAAEEPLSLREIVRIISETEANSADDTSDLPDLAMLSELLAEINDDLAAEERPFRLAEAAGGWQFTTSSEYGEYVHRLLKSKSRKRLSQAALETLAVIAYRQPVSKSDVEAARGVNSSEIVNALLEKELIQITGRAETPGRPLLYSTSLEFLRVFGLKSVGDLPKLRELDEFNTLRVAEEIAEDATDNKIKQP